MSAYTFYIKKNDRRPKLEVQLKNFDNTPLDLTDASKVLFLMTKNNGSLPKVATEAVVADAKNGLVEYEWQENDTDTVGTYKAELEIEWETNVKQTLPEDDYIKVIVKDDLTD